jgi:hypothetical protein
MKARVEITGITSNVPDNSSGFTSEISFWAARIPEYSPACMPDITVIIGPGRVPFIRATGIRFPRQMSAFE